MTDLIQLNEFTLPELQQLLAAWGQPSYRALQVLKWVYKGVDDFELMTDMARPFRQELARRARVGRLRVEQTQEAADGTR
ncbi:MAG TPA: hypothetical protein VGA79_03240, partial [Desulfobaccales bacterium]